MTANNSPNTCGKISISPLYLDCPSTGASQTLDSAGIPNNGQNYPCSLVVYNHAFTAAF